MKSFSLKEFKPTVIFLAKFLALYLTGSLLYGVFVTLYEPRPDPVTKMVTEQTAIVLQMTGHQVTVTDHPKKATATIRYQNRAIVSVYEGCNGINIAIIFLSFLFAFGPYSKKLFWFAPLGLIMIHFFNLVRIAGLFLITLYRPDWTYFVHKYLFTAFIYAFVFLLWLYWLKLTTVQKHGER